MVLGPITENLLLSNQAQFKCTTLGLNGLSMIEVPKGKAVILLEISLEPFINAPQELFSPQAWEQLLINNKGFTPLLPDIWNGIKQRLCFQLQMVNDKYNEFLTFQNPFSIESAGYAGDEALQAGTVINTHLVKQKEDVFIYLDRSIYFNFIYYDTITDGLVYDVDTYQNNFASLLQTLPPTPVTPNQSGTILNSTHFQNKSDLAYYPLRKAQTKPVPTSPPGESEGLRFRNDNKFSSITPFDSATVPQTETALDFKDLMILPKINCKYILVNLSPETDGLFKMPKRK